MQSMSDDEGTRPQYDRLMQAYNKIQSQRRGKREVSGRMKADESHAVLGTTPQSTREDVKKALKIQLLGLFCISAIAII